MYTAELRPSKAVLRMDPDCAICRAPASMACDCEAKGLETAIKQAEDRMMRSIYTEIKAWVRARAQDHILEYFRIRADLRKSAHSANLDRITAQAFYAYNQPPPQAQIRQAELQLKRGIDEDWQASVQRYPEVLAYFFSLVELTLPAEDEPSVKNPPLGAMNGYRKPERRIGAPGHDIPAMPPMGFPQPQERRTPAPRDRRSGHYRSAPPQPQFYGQY